MGIFEYDSFVDLSRVFDLKKGEIVPPVPKARVILFSSTALLPQSRFANLRAFVPMAKPVFIAASAKKMVAPADAIVPMPTAPAQVEAAPAPDAAAPKPRSTLRLKTKVELPPVTSRRSTPDEIVAAFKAEGTALALKKPLATSDLEDSFNKRRPHPLSKKPWSQLLAEAEALEARKPKRDFDLGAAFKAEMKAFMAEQEKLAAAEAPAAPAPAPRDVTIPVSVPKHKRVHASFKMAA